MTAFYVWYHVAADNDAARKAVASLFADIERRTGVAGRLLARLDDPNTWMEVYESVRDHDSFAAALAQCVEEHGFAAATGAASRHVERFAPIDAGGAS